MDYTLGLDLGISSVGWAVLRNNSHGEPYRIENLGVRVFKEAEHPKTGASLALPRREARGARRRLRRRRHRKERIRQFLYTNQVITPEALEAIFQNSGFAKDVYTLRTEGLDRLLTGEEWSRVLLHLAQRRGYRSNSTAETAKDKESGVLKQALSKNEILMQDKGYRTVGEMFCRDEKFQQIDSDGRVWRKTRNSPGDYSFTVTREMVEQEVSLLFAQQRQWGNPHASEEMETAYRSILFSQRGFDEGPGGGSPFKKGDLRGHCTFEKEELRAFKATYTFEYFKLLQDLNHIRLHFDNQPSRTLTAQERERIIALAMKSDGLTYARLRKGLSLAEDIHFNTVRYDGRQTCDEAEKKTKFSQMQSYHKLRKALAAIEKNYIHQLSHDLLDKIAEILSLYKSDNKRTEELKALGLTDPVINCLLPLSFSKAGHLSLTAMKKLIPHLEQGVRYDEACTAVYQDHRGLTQQVRSSTLSFGRLMEEGALAEITNPVVLRAVSQACKVLNAVVRQYGAPQAVHIELAREMSRNYADRKKMDRMDQERRAENERTMAQIEEIKGNRATGQDLVKFRLFREQKEICLYSGQKLDARRLFDPGYVDVDHIIPYSISFDDSYRNKVLVLTSENRQKGNRLPMEYMAGDPEKRDRFMVLVENHIRDYRKKQKLFKQTLTKEDEEGFRTRNLTDTQYITSVLHRILRDNLQFSENAPSKKRVYAVNGVITDYIRKRLGLQKNRADGDLHHAMDAVIVAITTDGMIQRISRYAKRREWGKKIRGQYVDPETGELLTQAAFDEKYAPDFPAPWPGFRQELEARLAPDPQAEIEALNLPNYDSEEQIKPVFVSQMPQRKVTGAAHGATIRSSRHAGCLLSKKPLTELTFKNGEIVGYHEPERDPRLYEALKKQLAAFGGDAKKAFSQPFHKPKRDGTPGPVVNKVRIAEKSSLNVAVRGGAAENGSMVRIDVFYVADDGYYFVPIYTADTVKPELPQKAVVANKPYELWKEMEEQNFLFSLYPGDLIQVRRARPISLSAANRDSDGERELKRSEWMLYYKNADISTGSITVTTHDRKYEKAGLGIKTLKSFEKYEVDPLGNYHKIHLPEKRQTFR